MCSQLIKKEARAFLAKITNFSKSTSFEFTDMLKYIKIIHFLSLITCLESQIFVQ
jgi:hypothetical protein